MTGAVYDTATLNFLPNPNEAAELRRLRRHAERMIPLFGPSFVPAGPVAAVPVESGFIILASGRSDRGEGLYWNALDASGTRLFELGEPALLLRTNQSIEVLRAAGGGSSFWLFWTEEDSSGLLTTIRGLAIAVQG